jgi:hypothetical protein
MRAPRWSSILMSLVSGIREKLIILVVKLNNDSTELLVDSSVQDSRINCITSGCSLAIPLYSILIHNTSEISYAHRWISVANE